MMETILNVLDEQVAMAPGSQKIKGLSSGDNQIKGIQGKEPKTSLQKEGYPDLFLPIVENYRISDCFCGYSESLSTDNNPMFLVELNNLSYRYGTSIYAVDRVIGLMVLCMVNSVWDIKSFLKRLQLYLNTNTLQWRMSMGPPMRIPNLELLI